MLIRILIFLFFSLQGCNWSDEGVDVAETYNVCPELQGS